MANEGYRFVKWDDDNTSAERSITVAADTATKLWGSSWRMPTQAELQALKDNCTWDTFSSGYTITGKGDYKNNSIFLPAAGFFNYVTKQVRASGSDGDYWSSTENGSGYAYDLYFDSGDQSVGSSDRRCGCSVRAVLKEN